MLELKEETGKDGADVLCRLDVEGYDSRGAAPRQNNKVSRGKKILFGDKRQPDVKSVRQRKRESPKLEIEMKRIQKSLDERAVAPKIVIHIRYTPIPPT